MFFRPKILQAYKPHFEKAGAGMVAKLKET